MKGFSFRLERLRALRERAERAQAAALGAAMRDEEARRVAMRAAAEHLERCHDQTTAGEGDTSSAGQHMQRSLARDAAAGRLEAEADSLHAAEERVEGEQARYGDSRRDLRTVEKLKEKQFETWREEQTRAERKDADDIALRRHGKGEQES